jgi:hypothetical protein
MLLGMALGRFIRVLGCEILVALRNMRMVSGLLVRAGFVLFRGLPVMMGRFVVMLRRLFMVLSTFMSRHILTS